MFEMQFNCRFENLSLLSLPLSLTAFNFEFFDFFLIFCFLMKPVRPIRDSWIEIREFVVGGCSTEQLDRIVKFKRKVCGRTINTLKVKYQQEAGQAKDLLIEFTTTSRIGITEKRFE